MIREIALDTETTGLDAKSDRIIEIGCIEIKNRVVTGNFFHTYINPERDISYHATRVHGLTREKLSNKPVFAEISQSFLDFIGDDVLVIHNAEFDMRFLNMELSRLNLQALSFKRVIDTLALARKKFSGSPASLDSLCNRFKISLKDRDLHGAKIDAELLAKVYIEMMGGVQISLGLSSSGISEIANYQEVEFLKPRVFKITEEEEKLHNNFLNKISKPIWKRLSAITS